MAFSKVETIYPGLAHDEEINATAKLSPASRGLSSPATQRMVELAKSGDLFHRTSDLKGLGLAVGFVM